MAVRAGRCVTVGPSGIFARGSVPVRSAGTAQGAQLPALFRAVERLHGWQRGSWNLDLGGGPYGRATYYLARQGVRNLVYDPGHSGPAELAAVRPYLGRRLFPTVTVANVLNVLPTAQERACLLREASSAVHPDGCVYLSVYEGNRSGRAERTSRGWQENRPRGSYVAELRPWFGAVEVRGVLLIGYPR